MFEVLHVLGRWLLVCDGYRRWGGLRCRWDPGCEHAAVAWGAGRNKYGIKEGGFTGLRVVCTYYYLAGCRGAAYVPQYAIGWSARQQFINLNN